MNTKIRSTEDVIRGLYKAQGLIQAARDELGGPWFAPALEDRKSVV